MRHFLLQQLCESLLLSLTAELCWRQEQPVEVAAAWTLPRQPISGQIMATGTRVSPKGVALALLPISPLCCCSILRGLTPLGEFELDAEEKLDRQQAKRCLEVTDDLAS